ncbi:MAG: Wzt carbohydrate-binding domain-containing protein, partial [Solirubrobacteraceae bacterium]
TMLFVTHDMGAVERFCDRALLIERGQVVDIGEPASIARQYNQHNFRLTRQEAGVAPEQLPEENPAVRVLNAVFESDDEEPLVTTLQGRPCTVRMDLQFAEPVEQPIFSIALLDELGHTAFSTNTDIQKIDTGRFQAGARATMRIRFENYLSPGRYKLIASAARAGLGADLYDAHHSNSIIVIPERPPGGGYADLPNTLTIERG